MPTKHMWPKTIEGPGNLVATWSLIGLWLVGIPGCRRAVLASAKPIRACRDLKSSRKLFETRPSPPTSIAYHHHHHHHHNRLLQVDLNGVCCQCCHRDTLQSCHGLCARGDCAAFLRTLRTPSPSRGAKDRCCWPVSAIYVQQSSTCANRFRILLVSKARRRTTDHHSTLVIGSHRATQSGHWDRLIQGSTLPTRCKGLLCHLLCDPVLHCSWGTSERDTSERDTSSMHMYTSCRNKGGVEPPYLSR